MEMPDIRSLVPHAGPMVLLDRVISVDHDSLCAEVTIRDGGLFCSPDGVGAWVGIEYMAQAIAAHAGHAARLRGEPVKIGFLLGSRRYECTRPLFAVGSVLRVHIARLLLAENGLGSFDCRIEDEDGVAATATVSVFLPANVDEFLNGSME
ncbi:3-hydroxylacyl-ACP dehydratase [Noviherbaspirillum sedimenti]|uniref:3-hydroxylacyl-ACP dehydratase n=1 Tax=Noviherbaspirillum sedimenti TaxID=2320865 RepID=A0A3A3G7M5_9BURK|nr:3-hydroxylacyl-ACP dehydratase [Noviherbaspirillum sedimenti]RJG02749.1 3-hydroxylacyl-ACP dehydratase [Noviherbaspirillum sedimenti]